MEIIDCKSLMIGDWVYRVDFKEPIPVRILGLEVVNYDTHPMQYIADVFCPKHNNNVGLYIDTICPIPLTAEILEKNGFVKQWNNNWQLNDYHSIIISENFYIAIFESSIRLDYVHELQHALRLAGIDKEIKL